MGTTPEEVEEGAEEAAGDVCRANSFLLRMLA